MADDVARLPARPRIDLETVRETLLYVRDDLASAPGLAKVEQALTRAIDEIAAVQESEQCLEGDGRRRSADVIPMARMNFVPWSPGR